MNNSTNILVRLLAVIMKTELSYSKNPKMCDPILVTPLKMQPQYSQPSRENMTPSSGTSAPLASYKEVPPGVYFSSKIYSNSFFFFFFHTSETAVVILLPPDAPITCCTSPLLSVKIASDMDENGRLPGSGKLTSEG